MADYMDPGIERLLSLPFFDDRLEAALLCFGLFTVELFLGFGASSSIDFVDRVVRLAPALGPTTSSGAVDSSALAGLTKVLDQLAILWTLIDATKDDLLRREMRLIGFGQAVPRPRNYSSGPASSAARQVAVPYAPAGSMPQALRRTAPVVSALMDLEIQRKMKWIRRLERLAIAAGAHSLFFCDQIQPDLLTADERDRLRKAVLAKGAFRTMAVHTRHLERFAQWATDRSLVFYPLTVDLLLKYLLWLDQKGCGPTVIPSVKAALIWVSSRLVISIPDTGDVRVTALEKDVIQNRAKGAQGGEASSDPAHKVDGNLRDRERRLRPGRSCFYGLALVTDLRLPPVR